MTRKLLIYPDRRLRQKSVEVAEFNADLHALLDDMREAMLEHAGVGLAAIQIGEPVRAFIINIPDDEGNQTKETLLEFINPKIVESEGEILYNEGCLSVPEFTEEVARFESVVIEYSDRDGVRQKREAHGLLSIAIQHEYDHLEGRLFLERLPMLKRKKFEKEWKKLAK
ncbi:peptide deformylase [Campylobacterota bacterium]|nr:peptide deformylase [Campylobacterota bacterium]